MAKPDLALRDKTDMYYVYVLKSLKDNRLYIGYSKDLKTRFKAHTPWKLVYYESYVANTDATKREKQLKMHAAKNELKSRLKYSLE